MLIASALCALVNLAFIAGIPFLVYFVHHRFRRERSLGEVAARAGLRLGEGRYLAYSAALAVVAVVALFFWPPPAEPFVREGSPQSVFRGLGLSGSAVARALLYGVVATGFSEELLFRGLIAGSLSSRLSLPSANLAQAVVFFAPHLLVLRAMPEMWGVLPFVGALLLGWIRIRSGSVLGPWLVHGVLNRGVCLSVAVQTAA